MKAQDLINAVKGRVVPSDALNTLLAVNGLSLEALAESANIKATQHEEKAAELNETASAQEFLALQAYEAAMGKVHETRDEADGYTAASRKIRNALAFMK